MAFIVVTDFSIIKIKGVSIMEIRKTKLQDLPYVMDVYKYAQKFMVENGNPNQWSEGYPPQIMIEDDIIKGLSYVCVDDDKILAVFYFDTAPDSTYAKIDGEWKNSDKYGVVHRIARARDAKGAGAFCLAWCHGQVANIRIDTHKDNEAMRALLPKLGYEYCGVIWLDNGDARMAFQRVGSIADAEQNV